MNLVSKIKDVIEREKLVEPGEKVLVGVSGGIDSTVLLHLLLEIAPHLSFTIGVAHINHLLRGDESERDEGFVRALAERFSLPFHGTRVDVKGEAAGSGKSLQHVGRDVRYRFYEETSSQGNYRKVAVAHTLDDQVETFILRMVKGTGMRGLSAIPMKRGNIVRPLLYTPRAEIEGYAREKGITFVTDSSNEKIVYERNFVRKQIIPWMEKLNPTVREKVISLLGDLTSANTVFDQRAEEFLKTVTRQENGDISMSVKGLAQQDEEVAFRAVARLLETVEPGFIPLREHMRQVENVLRGRRPNCEATLPHRIRIRRAYDVLTITKRPSPLPPGALVPVKEGTNELEAFGITLHVDHLPLGGEDPAFSPGPDTAFFDSDRLEALAVRTFRDGDRFIPFGMKDEVKLKNFFMSRKIPREERGFIPLLLSGGQIIWVVGRRVDERYRATKETARVTRVRLIPPSGSA